MFNVGCTAMVLKPYANNKGPNQPMSQSDQGVRSLYIKSAVHIDYVNFTNYIFLEKQEKLFKNTCIYAPCHKKLRGMCEQGNIMSEPLLCAYSPERLDIAN